MSVHLDFASKVNSCVMGQPSYILILLRVHLHALLVDLLAVAVFRSWISKISNTFIDNAENLDIVILMYNLLQYSDNYSMTSGRFWNYYRDEVNDSADEIAPNRRINKCRTTTNKFFKYKTKIIGKRSADDVDTKLLFH